MPEKKLVVDTTEKKGLEFLITESAGKYIVYTFEWGWVLNSSTEIGRARSFDDAVAIVKASVPGRITSLQIK